MGMTGALIHFATLNAARGYHSLFISFEGRAGHLRRACEQMLAGVDYARAGRTADNGWTGDELTRIAAVRTRTDEQGNFITVLDAETVECTISSITGMINTWRNGLIERGVAPHKCVTVYIDTRGDVGKLACDYVGIKIKAPVKVLLACQAPRPVDGEAPDHLVPLPVKMQAEFIARLSVVDTIGTGHGLMDFTMLKAKHTPNGTVKRLIRDRSGRLWASQYAATAASKAISRNDVDTLYRLLQQPAHLMPGVL